MEHPLPTPPRSPAPSCSKDFYKFEENLIKNERLSPALQHFDEDFFLSENPFEDFWGVDFGLNSNIGGSEGSNGGGVGRKRKLSELLNMDMEQFLRDLDSPTTPTQTTPTTTTLLDTLLQNLETTTPPPTRPPSPTPHLTQSNHNSTTNQINQLLNFLSSPSHSPSYLSNYSEELETKNVKRQKFDSFSSSDLNIYDDVFLSSPNSPNFSDFHEKPQKNIEELRKCVQNDHNYCAVLSAEDILVDGVEMLDKFSGEFINFDSIPKKTKILVPLKSLMKTLQQKSFLVSPLGPGKKVIRLTGEGASVKGVLQSSVLPNPHLSPTPPLPQQKGNVRKRPHSQLLITKLTQEELSPSTPPPSSSSSLPKKKTKAHNNMERMRRIDLRNSFDNLKKLVPILAKSPKCSKVEILRRAEEYVRGLRGVEKRLIKEEGLLRVRMGELKGRLDLG